MQTAAAITVSVLVLGALALVVVIHSQYTAAATLLRQTAVTEATQIDGREGGYLALAR